MNASKWIYKSLNARTPDGLKDVHTISFFHLFKSAINKRGGTDQMYLDFQEYFERDGVVKFFIKGKWICLISDPVIVKNMLLRPDTFPKLDLKEYSPIYSRHLGVNVVHSNGDTIPVHFFVETGLKLMNVLERIDNKPIENLEDPNNPYVTTYNDVYQGLIHNTFANIFPLERIPFWLNRAFKKIDKLHNLFDEIIKNKHKFIAAGKSN
ncbi:35032_t:CDS:2, partial [Gigaspora margarita]